MTAGGFLILFSWFFLFFLFLLFFWLFLFFLFFLFSLFHSLFLRSFYFLYFVLLILLIDSSFIYFVPVLASNSHFSFRSFYFIPYSNGNDSCSYCSFFKGSDSICTNSSFSESHCFSGFSIRNNCSRTSGSSTSAPVCAVT